MSYLWGIIMNNKGHEIQDNRNLVQRAIGVLLLDECPKCNRYAFTAPSYDDGGSCSACGYTTPMLYLDDDE